MAGCYLQENAGFSTSREMCRRLGSVGEGVLVYVEPALTTYATIYRRCAGIDLISVTPIYHTLCWLAAAYALVGEVFLLEWDAA